MALHTRALVAAKWLADAVKCNRVGPSLRVLDTSWYLPKLKRNAKKEFKQKHIPDTEPGHIPGSINMPFTSFLAPSGLTLPREEMTGLFQRAGVDLGRPVCVSCGSGVTACHVALAAHLCGHPGVSVYDGAWSEWYTRAVPENVISDGRGKHV
ncbi:3-mercaptopyruvate sulfurtransferase-like isoform X2 [Anguilla anguilla]|uniref:3-mercaptopyruvate sulfurtransferase-like isoform X2 n=1 Tax=Anguilla anguilla TaxID=7936 RepID=UPI0015AC53DF|nr:3-mercaptopyruvate sulfurtransferase-like isoform X2 [Anguilla anguilla]